MVAAPLQYGAAMGLVQGSIQLFMQLMNRGPQKDAHDQRERHHAQDVEQRERHQAQHRASQEAHGRAMAEVRNLEHIHQIQLQRDQPSYDYEARNWPLNLSPKDYEQLGLDGPSRPLVVFAPPSVADPDLYRQVQLLCEGWIRDIVEQGYACNDLVRPVTFLGDGWNKGAPRSETALRNLYNRRKDAPTVVIQLEYINKQMQLLVGCFGFQKNRSEIFPTFRRVPGSLPFVEWTAEAAKRELESLQSILTTLSGDKPIELARFGINPVNVSLYALEQTAGQSLDHYYRPSPSHVLEAMAALAPALQLITAMFADFFHWTANGVTPLLPSLLPQIARGFPVEMSLDLSQQIIAQYESIYSLSSAAMPDSSAAEHLLHLAEAFAAPEAGVQDKSLPKQILEKAVSRFLSARLTVSGESLIEYAQRHGKRPDVSFLMRVANLLRIVGNVDEANLLRNCIAAIGEISHDLYVEKMTNILKPDGFSA